MASNQTFPEEDLELEIPVFGRLRPIGKSAAFLDFLGRLGRVASVDRPVLLIGERGTGKEMAAQRLHGLSRRSDHVLVTLNCSALAPSLIESELFGHERGAFTGASQQRIGRFEAANGGTLFLDEISLIPLETQEKILRVVEYGAFERVGGTRPIQVDVRIIGATNTDLAREAATGRFKPDLLDRLSFEVLYLPPLRARAEDIPELAIYFAARMLMELGRSGIPQFSDEALAALVGYPWPGNIRELKNVIERAVYRSDSEVIDAPDIEFEPFRSPYVPAAGIEATPPGAAAETGAGAAPRLAPAGFSSSADVLDLGGLPLEQALGKVELHFLHRALKAARFNQRAAAKTLGLSYHQFRRLYRKYQETLGKDE